MRKINYQNNRFAAQVQRTIINTTMDALDELYSGPSLISSTILSSQEKYQIVKDPSLPPGMVQVVPNQPIMSANNVQLDNSDIAFSNGSQNVAATIENNAA